MKDLIRYGADKLSSSDLLRETVDAVVDASAATLGLMAPEFMPAIAALQGAIKQPLHSVSQKAITAAKEWAVQGHNAVGHPVIRSTPGTMVLEESDDDQDDQDQI